jgi:membrane protein required for colicin V production
LPNLILGGVTGALRGVFIILIAVLLMGLTSAPSQSWWKGSVFAKPLGNLALAASKYLPKDVSRHIRYN